MARNYWEQINRANKRAEKKSGTKKKSVYDSISPGYMYTGNGSDGITQPGRPAAVDMTGGGMRILHEDEIVQPNGNGVKVTPSPKTKFMEDVYVPKNEREQFEIKQMQDMMGAAGYGCGGKYSYQSGGQYNYGDQQPQSRSPLPVPNPYNTVTNKHIKKVPGPNPKPINPDPILVGPNPNPVNVDPFIVGPNPDPINIDPINIGNNTGNNSGNNLIGQNIGGKIPNPNNDPFNKNNFNVTKPDKIPNSNVVQNINTTPVNQNQVPWQNTIGNNNSQSWIDKFKLAQSGGKVDKNPFNTHDPLKDPVVDPFTVDPFVIDPIIGPDPDPINVDPFTVDPVVNPDQIEQQDDTWKKNFLAEYQKLMQSNMDSYMAQTLAAQKASGQRAASSPYLTEGAIRAGHGEAARTAGLVGSDLANKAMSQSADKLLSIEEMGIQQDQWNKMHDLDKQKFKEQMDFAKQKYGDSQLFADIAGGMKYDQIQAKYPDLNITETDYNSMVEASPIGMQKFNKQLTGLGMMLEAKDYDAAGALFKSMGMGDIDFSKVESIDTANTVISGIDNIISGLGPDADPNLLAFLGGLKGNVWGNVWKSLGIDTGNGIITNQDGTQTNIGDLVNGINNNTITPVEEEVVLNIGTNAQNWLDSTIGGEIFKSQLEATGVGSELSEKMASGDAGAMSKYGQLVGAAFAQDNGYKLNDNQKDLLKEYDLYDESMDISNIGWNDVAPYDKQIKDALKDGNSDEAMKIYNSLNDKEKELLGPIQDYIDKHEDYKQTINTLLYGSYDDIINNFPKEKTDDIYQEMLTHDSTLQGIGTKKEHTGSGNNQYYFSALGTKSNPKVSKGDIVNIDGQLLVFEKIDFKTKSGSDTNTYYFYDPVTGKRKSIKASKGGSSWQNVG